MYKCMWCGGTGKIQGMAITVQECSTCKGTGKTEEQWCFINQKGEKVCMEAVINETTYT